MVKDLIISSDQLYKIGQLVDVLGVIAYRDAKHYLDIQRMKPAQTLTRLEADLVIDRLEQLKAGGRE